MFAAMAALNRRKTTLNPTTSGFCLMMGSLLTRAAESNVRQGVAAVTKKRGTEAPRPCSFHRPPAAGDGSPAAAGCASDSAPAPREEILARAPVASSQMIWDR